MAIGESLLDRAHQPPQTLRIVQRTDPRGYDYYWFGLGPMVQTPGHSTDLEAIDDGYVAVSPLHLDLTHEASLQGLRETFEAAE